LQGRHISYSKLLIRKIRSVLKKKRSKKLQLLLNRDYEEVTELKSKKNLEKIFPKYFGKTSLPYAHEPKMMSPNSHKNNK